MDARFQNTFVGDAMRAGKLPRDWRIPEAARANTPERLAKKFAPWRERGLFAELPFGTDFTADELLIAKALRNLQAQAQSWPGRLSALAAAIFNGSAIPAVQSHLVRMGLDKPGSPAQTVQRRLLIAALRKILHSG
jgi:hypothetical protein